MTTPSKPVRLIYVDDSGAERSGHATYSWLELRIDDWRLALRQVLDWRHQLARDYQIPVTYELHATKFVNGRGNPSLDPDWNRHKAKRSLVVDDAFQMLTGAPWLSVGTVYSHTSLRGRGFADERTRVYGELVTQLDRRLTAAGEFGILYMDGDGTDRSYIAAHRELKLATRSLIEDPAFQHSHSSHLVQVADLIAYASYQHILQLPEKWFAWPWYPSLAGKDVNGGPVAV